jgi:nitrite reductase (NADH) large subunit
LDQQSVNDGKAAIQTSGFKAQGSGWRLFLLSGVKGPETANEEEIFVPSDDVREHLVVVGNGMAGCRAVEELLARDAGRYRVTIFGAEPYVNYNRIMLSPVLAGEKSFDDIVINNRQWYDDNGIELIAGDPVTAIDRAAKPVGPHCRL